MTRDDIIDALTQALEYFEANSDIIDGDYGIARPNTEMRLAGTCSRALDALEADKTLTFLIKQEEAEAYARHLRTEETS